MSVSHDIPTPSPSRPGTNIQGPGIAAAWSLLARGPLSGVLLYAAFPPVDQPWLTWIALVPLFSLVDSTAPRVRLFVSAWLGGLCFWIPTMIWIWELHPRAWVGWIVMGVVLSLFWVIFFTFARSARAVRLPRSLAIIAAWLATDYLQAFAFSGFPWYQLAHAHFRTLPLIQVADVLGAWGVTLVVLLVNIAALDLLRWLTAAPPGKADSRTCFLRSGVTTSLILVATLTYGAFRLTGPAFLPGPQVILLQSNLRQALKMGLDGEKILDIYDRLIAEGLDEAERLGSDGDDVVIWPETSYPFGYVIISRDMTTSQATEAARQLDPDISLTEWLRRRQVIDDELAAWATSIHRPMVVGAVLNELDAQGGRKSNAALWIDPERNLLDVYRKIHLVPFGEYMPLLRELPFLKQLAPYEEGNLPRLVSGRVPQWFDRAGYRWAPVICFEDTLPHLVRRFFAEVPDGRHPDVLVNMSNDGWFNGTAEHDLHLATSVFRAVENRAPIVRSANMGYSAIVDGNGRITHSQPKSTEGVVVGRVPLDPRRSLYSSVGDLLPQLCLIVSTGSVLLIAIYRLISLYSGKPSTPQGSLLAPDSPVV